MRGSQRPNYNGNEPSELIYFKVYKSQIPVIEQSVETAARMPGTDKSRGYCLEMICADFLAGAYLDNGNPEILIQSLCRYYGLLPSTQNSYTKSHERRLDENPSQATPSEAGSQNLSQAPSGGAGAR